MEGEYEGLYLLPLLRAMADSSWDFPSAMFALGMGELFADEEPTMHPAEEEAEIVIKAANLNDDEVFAFTAGFFGISWYT